MSIFYLSYSNLSAFATNFSNIYFPSKKVYITALKIWVEDDIYNFHNGN